MTIVEARERARIAWWALRGSPVVWRANFRWEEDGVLRIRPIDPTVQMLVRSCYFDTNPDAGNDLVIAFGDAG